MKPRPRSVEREVAKHLSRFFLQNEIGNRVERIPVLGRTGPDIDTNNFLAVDVKSRLSVPKGYRLNKSQIGIFGDLIGVRLDAISLLIATPLDFRPPSITSSVVVDRWMDHMAEWVDANLENGIPALVLHEPGRWVKTSTFLIRTEDRRKFNDKFRTNDI